MSKMFPIPVNTPVEVRRGLVLMVLGALLIPGLDAAAKLLAEVHRMSVGEIALARFILQTVMVLPLLLAVDGAAALRVRHAGLNLLRGVLLGWASFSFFLALKYMPLADATAIFFIEPMLVTLLSGWALGERVGRLRLGAVIGGFVGALIVIRPNFTSPGLAAGLPLVTAALVAAYSILSRRLSAGSTPLAMHFYAGLGGTAALAVIVLPGSLFAVPEFALAMPRGAAVWSLLLMVGGFATVGHLIFIQAYRLAPASVLAPLGYLEIISATALGYIIFSDLPDAVTCLGIAIIVASGSVIFLHERSAGVEAVHTSPPPQ